MSPDDAQTADEGRVVHPLYSARMRRLQSLADAMAVAGAAPLSAGSVDRRTALAIKREIDKIEQGG